MKSAKKNYIFYFSIVLLCVCFTRGYTDSKKQSAPNNLKEVYGASNALFKSAKQAYQQAARMKKSRDTKGLYWNFYLKAKEFHEVLLHTKANDYSEAETIYGDLHFAYNQLQNSALQNSKDLFFKMSFPKIKKVYTHLAFELQNSNIFYLDAEVVEYSSKHGHIKKVKQF